MSNSQIAVWDFRANKEMFTSGSLKIWCKTLSKKWAFQLESGDSGYEHWQGRLSLTKKRRVAEIKGVLESLDLAWPNYMQPTSCNAMGDQFYVLKADTRIEGPWTDKDVEMYVPRQYRGISLYPWQQEVLDSKNLFDFRRVDCIVDKTGNIGKTTVASLAELRYGAVDLPAINDHEKVIATLCDILIAKQCREPGIVFVDLPRAFDKRNLASYYVAIEQIKKGKVYDLRYSYKEWWFDSPRVWVFTNVQPDQNLLSRDRWHFHEIDTGGNLIPYNADDF